MSTPIERHGPLTALDLRDQRFARRPMGYDRGAVDRLLVDVADELERLTKTSLQHEDRVRQLEAELHTLRGLQQEWGAHEEATRLRDQERVAREEALRQHAQELRGREESLRLHREAVAEREESLRLHLEALAERERGLRVREEELAAREEARAQEPVRQAPPPAPQPEPSLLRADLRAEAEREAQLIIREARAAAERQVHAAQAELRKLQTEVPALWSTRLAELAAFRQQLERQLQEVLRAEEASPPDLQQVVGRSHAAGAP